MKFASSIGQKQYGSFKSFPFVLVRSHVQVLYFTYYTKKTRTFSTEVCKIVILLQKFKTDSHGCKAPYSANKVKLSDQTLMALRGRTGIKIKFAILQSCGLLLF